VIEDEPALRSLVIKVLAANGYQTLEAANGEEALRIASRYRAFIDLVISDVVMPRMRGPEVIARLRRLLPDVRVLYMSGYADNALSYLRDRDPEAPFLAKPFLPDALLRKVREVLSLVPPSPAGSVIRSGPPWSSTGLALSGI
jgi:CheY-like chemotaxis protein